MPYDPDQPLEEDYPLVQSDLLDLTEAEPANARESPELDSDLAQDSGPTVVNLNDEPAFDEQQDGMPAPVADMGDEADGEPLSSPAPAPKKRGRPSRSASGTPAAKAAPSNTPKSTKTTTPARSAGRKRKSPNSEPEDEAEPESEPAPAKRGRPARITGIAASARLTAQAAKKPTRGRPKGTSAATTKKPAKVGRPKKDTTGSNGVTPDGEFEVEAIVESRIDADTMTHMYLIKWKGYASSENTWEPKKNLSHALDLVKGFEAKKKTPAESAPAGPKGKKRPGRKPKAKT